MFKIIHMAYLMSLDGEEVRAVAGTASGIVSTARFVCS
jgi:hypothetical protein